jgi:hypothetical protein
MPGKPGLPIDKPIDTPVDVDESALAKRLKKIPGWRELPEDKLAEALQQQILYEAGVPTAQQIAAERQKIKDDESGIAYGQRSVLLSVNAKPNLVSLSCVVREAVTIDGEIRERGTLKTLAIADAAKTAKLSTAEQEFVAAIQSAITKFVEA